MNFKSTILLFLITITPLKNNASDNTIKEILATTTIISCGLLAGVAGYFISNNPEATKEIIKTVPEVFENKNNLKQFALDKGIEKYTNSLVDKAYEVDSLSDFEKRELANQFNQTAAGLFHLAQKTNDQKVANKSSELANKLYQIQPSLAVDTLEKAPLRDFFNEFFKIIGTGCHYLAGTKAQHSSEFNQKYAAFIHRLGDKSYNMSKNIAEHKGIFTKPLDNIDLNNNIHCIGLTIGTIVTTYTTYKIIKKCIYQPTKNTTNRKLIPFLKKMLAGAEKAINTSL